ADIHELVAELTQVSPEFKAWWRKHDVHTAGNSTRKLIINGKAEHYDHTSLTIDADRHLRLVIDAKQIAAATDH
ncbi:MAG TPA: transcriptional regulator, partial [Advenella sp.]|nr:transcriptional regulator [Advenella sp.]